jgi:hypothetical protein
MEFLKWKYQLKRIRITKKYLKVESKYHPLYFLAGYINKLREKPTK